MAQMEVSYSRRLDYQYMMIETDEEARSDYRLSMLINNRINGFLPVHVQQMNGKSTLSYEITSLETYRNFLMPERSPMMRWCHFYCSFAVRFQRQGVIC